MYRAIRENNGNIVIAAKIECVAVGATNYTLH